MSQSSRHQCQIYEGPPSSNLPAVAAIIRQKLAENRRCVYFNSPPMVQGLRSALAANDVDVGAEVYKGRIVFVAGQDHLVDGAFDGDEMLRRIEIAIDRAIEDGFAGLWATGDMSWEFGNKQDFSRLLEYEWKLEDLFRRRPELSGVCQYHADTLPREVLRHGLVAHRSLFVNDTLSHINPHYIRPDVYTPQAAANAELDQMIIRLCRP